MYELIGYIASALVALSLMMKSIVKLRWLNMSGALVFCVYGLAIKAYPVFIMNLFIVGVNLYYLRQMHQVKEYFELLRLTNSHNVVLRRFIAFHKDEIRKFFPKFVVDDLEHSLIFFILRDMHLAGVFAADLKGGTLWVKLDYATPQYRDFHTAIYLYSQLKPMLGQLGVKHVVARSSVPQHVKYLEKVGFRRDEAFGANAFVLQ